MDGDDGVHDDVSRSQRSKANVVKNDPNDFFFQCSEFRERISVWTKWMNAIGGESIKSGCDVATPQKTQSHHVAFSYRSCTQLYSSKMVETVQKRTTV